MRLWDGSGTSWTICKQSAPCSIQITTPTPHHSIFTGQILFLTPNQQCYSIEGTHLIILTQSKYQWRSDLQSEVNNLNGDEESYQLEQAVPYWCQKLYSALIKTSEGVQQNETSTDSWRGIHRDTRCLSWCPTNSVRAYKATSYLHYIAFLHNQLISLSSRHRIPFPNKKRQYVLAVMQPTAQECCKQAQP